MIEARSMTAKGGDSGEVVRTFTQVFDDVMGREDLSLHEALILCYLEGKKYRNGAPGNPSIKTIATWAKCGRTTVIEAIKKLETIGDIQVLRTKGKTSRYVVNQSTTRTSPADGPVHETDGTSPRDGRDQSARRTQSRPSSKSRSRPKLRDWDLVVSCMKADTLHTDAFHEAWEAWVVYHRERRKPLTRSTIKHQISMLEAFGHGTAIASIEASIRNGWTGLFDGHGDKHHGNNNTARVRNNASVYAGRGIVAGPGKAGTPPGA